MRGSIAMAMAQVIANVASFAIAWAIARGMGESAYGIFAAAYALATSVASLADSGVRMALIREVARTPSHWRCLWLYALIISALLAIIVSFAFAVIILLEEAAASQELRLWLLGYALLWTAMRITLGVPAGQQRLVDVSLWGAAERVAGAVLVGWLAFFGGGSLLQLAQWLCLLELLMLVLLALWIMRQHWPVAPAIELTPVAFARVALPFGMAAAAYAVLGRLDLIVLGFQQPPAVTGHYAAAQLLAMVGVFVGVTVAGALFPALSHLAKSEDAAQTRRLIEPATGLLTLLMVLFAVLLSLLSEWLLAWVYGPDFVVGSIWLLLFALASPFVAIGSMAGAVIGAWGWQGRWAKVLWGMLIAAVPLYWLGGSFVGVWGVALVSIGLQLLLAAIAWRWMAVAGLVDVAWLLRLAGLMVAIAASLYLLPGTLSWLVLPLAVAGVFLLRICRVAWIGTALRLAR